MSQIDISELTNRKTSAEYPSILITAPNETLPVVVRTLEKGDMQLIVELNGVRKVVSRISPSAYNVDKLLRTTGHISYRKSPSEIIEVRDIPTYLSCV